MSFIILSMVAFPAMSMDKNVPSALSSCCTSSGDSQEESPTKDDCCNKGCNPFVNCCGMMGFMLTPFQEIAPTTLTTVHAESDDYLDPQSQCAIDIWQPPKV
jgi:hypothetical protein